MVRYTGRARTRTGSVNTNQLGLKMSGCPSTVGKKGRIARYMGRRVDCMMGFCRPVRYHEVIWPRTRMRNQPPFCKRGATRCQAAAGGVGTNHNIPYYRTPKKGESGCTPRSFVHTISASFNPGETTNALFHDLNHHIMIVPSGSGFGNPKNHGLPIYGYVSPFGLGPSANLGGIVGFKSNAEPYPEPFYAAFAESEQTDPHALTTSPNTSIVSNSNWWRQGRYLRSKTIAELDIHQYVSGWKDMEEMTVVWIAGNNNNGGDKPDMHTFNNSNCPSSNPLCIALSGNQAYPNQTGLPTDTIGGDYKMRENLYIQFFDSSKNPVGGRVYLWKTKRDLTAAELLANTPTTLNPWTPIPGNVYPSDKFAATTIKKSQFSNQLSNASFFVIRQERHTAKLDNYGVKFVSMTFRT